MGDKDKTAVVVDDDASAEQFIEDQPAASAEDDAGLKDGDIKPGELLSMDINDPGMAPSGDHKSAEEKAAEAEDDDLDKDESDQDEDSDDTDDGEVDEDVDADDDDAREADEEKAPEFSKEILDRAKMAGLEDDDVEVYQSEAALTRTLDLMLGKKLAEESGEVPPVPAPTPEPKPEPTPEPKPVVSGEEPEYLKKMKEDPDFEEDLVSAIEGTHAENVQLSSEVKSLAGTVEKLMGVIKTDRHQQNADWMDGKLGDLGKEWEGTFGKGSYRDLKSGDKTYKNRLAVAEAIEVIAQGYLAKKMPVPPRDTLFEWAVNSRFADKIKGNVRKQLSAATKKKKSQSITRPTRRRAKGMTREENAVNNLGDRMREMGLEVE